MLNELPRNRVDRPSSLHFGRLAAQSSKAAHSPQLLTESAGAKRRISARGGEWGEQTLQQACSQAYPGSAICVQNFDDSLNSAIRITYRISLRSSSLREPRYPLLKVVFGLIQPWPGPYRVRQCKISTTKDTTMPTTVGFNGSRIV